MSSDYLPARISEVGEFAMIASKSGMFGAGNPDELVVKLMAGASWGIPPLSALSDVYVVKGKPMASSTLLRAMIRKSGNYDYRVVEHTDQAAEIEFLRVLPSGDREVLGSTRFDMVRAKAQGLTSNRLYQTAPRNMLLARATSDGVKTHCPDVFMGSIYAEGEITDGPPVHLPPQRAEPEVVRNPRTAEIEVLDQAGAVVNRATVVDQSEANALVDALEAIPDPNGALMEPPAAEPEPAPVGWSATFAVPAGVSPARWEAACTYGMNAWDLLLPEQKAEAEVKPHDVDGLLGWAKCGGAWLRLAGAGGAK